MLRTTCSLAMACLVMGAAHADIIWSNVGTIPGDLETTADAWSAVRAEDQNFISYRCAADDFILTQTTRIDKIVYYSVPIGDPEILGGDYYIWTVGSNGHPDQLLAGEADIDHAYLDTGWSNPNFGPIKRNELAPANLVLGPGHYYLGMRTFQTFEGHSGKDTNGILSTRKQFGQQRARWNFGVLSNGDVIDGWMKLQDFNLVPDNEWAFELEGTVVPEPATILLLAAGSANLARRMRRRRG